MWRAVRGSSLAHVVRRTLSSRSLSSNIHLSHTHTLPLAGGLRGFSTIHHLPASKEEFSPKKVEDGAQAEPRHPYMSYRPTNTTATTTSSSSSSTTAMSGTTRHTTSSKKVLRASNIELLDTEKSDPAADVSLPEKRFSLSTNFLKKYRDRTPPFGFNGLGELVYRRTYSRLKEDG